MGTNLPDNFADGQELEASELNKMLVARSNSMLPIDDTTRNETDLAGGLGSATKRYTEAHIDNLKIDGNTISSTDTDGDITITPDGDGNINLTTVAGRTKITRLISTGYGSESTKSVNRSSEGTTTDSTTTQATKDIFVNLTANFENNSGGGNTVFGDCSVTIQSDGNSTPTTTIGYIRIFSTGRTSNYSCGFFVPKGNYYKVSVTVLVTSADGATLTTTATWRAIEIGA